MKLSPRGRRLFGFALDNLVWLILLIALGAFALLIPKFFQIGILLNILEQSTFVGIIAVGLSLTLIAGQMDLSVESVMALAAMLVALTFGTGGAGGGLALHPAWLALPVSLGMALGIGVLVGLLNGLLVVRFEINAFIVTLASYIWGRGLVVALSGGRSVYGLPDSLRIVAIHRPFGIPMLAWVLVAVFAAMTFVLGKTPFGRHLFMIGGNPVASRRAGIRVDRNVILAFVLSGLLAGLAGLAARRAHRRRDRQSRDRHAVPGLRRRRHRRRQPPGRRGPARRRLRRRAAALLDPDRDQRHGDAAALHDDDPGHARPGGRPARHRQERPTPQVPVI